MLVAGVDVGAATGKAVIMDEEGILSHCIMPTGHDVVDVGNQVAIKALDQIGRTIDDLDYVVSTGYARRAITFSNKSVSEIICHAKGAKYLIPETKAIIDIGGQDSKALTVGKEGRVLDFVMNDKCAAGTGRFLEVMANVLNVDLEEMGAVSLTSKDPCYISSTCTIFAESEMVSLRAEKRNREDIIAGIHKAVASRVMIMGATIDFIQKTIFTGGVAKNIGVKKALDDLLGFEILVPEEPQIIGAVGAALMARAEVLH